MRVRKLFLCGVASVALSPLAAAVAQAVEQCEVGKGCGLQGERGAMQDDSLVQSRSLGFDALPILPANAERELPREKLVLWQRETPLGVREQVANVGEEKLTEVVLRDGLPVLHFASGRAVVAQTDSDAVEQLMQRLSGKRNLRLKFIGHTDPQNLSANARAVYTDNLGLGLQRAKEVGALFIEKLKLSPQQVVFDSKGASEPIAKGNSQEAWALNRRVEVEVWYDESAVVAVPRAEQSTCDAGSISQASVAPFRLSIDGQPQGEQARGSANAQRCVDVALAQDLLQVRYDNLSAKPRLNVVSSARLARVGQPLTFKAYSNYLHWIDRAEVRIIGRKRVFGEPEVLLTIPLNESLEGQWTPAANLPEQVYYQLRVYDKEGRFDETFEQPLQVARGVREEDEEAQSDANLLAGYDGNRLSRHTIAVAGGTVTVNGKHIEQGQHVFVMGKPVPLDQNGNFASAQIIPRGLNTVEVAVLNDEGKGRIYRRDLRLPTQDWFTVAIADFTVGKQNTSGPAQLVTGTDRYYDDKLYADGRLAFYTKGVVNDKYTVTASVDTGEEAVKSLFSNFNEKDPREFLRRMDNEADKGWTTFGDDSTLVEDAPTRGKFYARIEDEKSHAMWGNFRQQMRDTDLAQIDRSLYGAQARYRSDAFTSFGERRLQVEGFAAEPGTLAAREDFRGTGGSLYYLRHQDISVGTERVRIEVRDKDSGMVLYTQNLVSGIDYQVNSLQGRILLNEPLSANAGGAGLIRANGSLSGNPAYLVVGYEYTPESGRISDTAIGGRAAYWFTDGLRVGVTGSRQEQTGNEDQTLAGIDVLVRRTENTWAKFEFGQTKGDSLDQSFSFDGGFGFGQEKVGSDSKAYAQRVEAAINLRDVTQDMEGSGTFYYEHRDAGYSAPGSLAQYETDQVGGSWTAPLTATTEITIKADSIDEKSGRTNRAVETALAYTPNENWRYSAGLRHDRKTYAQSYTNPYTGGSYTDASRSEGSRTDVIAQATYTGAEDWSAYGFAQGTASRDDTRQANNRLGVGGSYRLTERASLNGEISGGNLGVGALAGVNYEASERTNLYMNYQLDNDRSDDGFASRSGLMGDGRVGQLVTGARSRWTDTVSVYGEQRLQHGEQAGLIQGYGLDFAPNERWSYGLTTEFGTINSESEYELKRRTLGAKVGYSNGAVRYASRLEYRKDKSAMQDLTVWLMRNNLSYQVNPDWRFLGRLDFSFGNSSRGDYFDGDFVEASVGYAYRPIMNDRLNMLIKYTYLADIPPPDQVSNATGREVDYAQRSHVFAIDAIYDINARWSIGGKYAHRLGQLRMSRDTSSQWFSSRGQLLAARVDWHVVKKWDLMLEVRRREESQASDSKNGALFAVYRHFGNNFKAGVGYNFAKFNDDLTDMSYRSKGWFINAVGKY